MLLAGLALAVLGFFGAAAFLGAGLAFACVGAAVCLVDFELNILDPGLQLVIKPDEAALQNMGDFVREMHKTSGLLKEIPSGLSLEETEQRCIEYVNSVPAIGSKVLRNVFCKVRPVVYHCQQNAFYL